MEKKKNEQVKKNQFENQRKTLLIPLLLSTFFHTIVQLRSLGSLSL